MSFGQFELFVNGTLMRGLALHKNLAGTAFLGSAATEAKYRLFSIDDIHPAMYRLEDGEEGGISVKGELYLLTQFQWETVEAGEPPHLYRGPVTLRDGREVYGILYPRNLAEQRGIDISAHGDWRSYINSKAR